MRSPNLDRTHIVIDRRERERWRKFAEKHYHGSLSQAVRAAMEDSIVRSRNGGGLIELQPVIERLDAIERAMEPLAHVSEKVEMLCSINEANSKTLRDAIVNVLEDAPAYTEEIVEKIPGHTIQEIRGELENLADNKFVVEQIDDGERVRWKLLGGETDG